MKYELHVPVEQYGFIAATIEGSAEDAVIAYKELARVWNGAEGVGISKLAQIIHEYCTTGAIAEGGGYDFSTNERLLLNEIKKLVRKNK